MRYPRATLLAAALALGGCSRIDARYQAHEGVDLYKRGDFAGAARRFEAATRLDPTLPVLFLDSGTVNLALFRAEGKSALGEVAAARAIAGYETYLRMTPGDERVRSALVQTFVESGRYEDAVAFYRPQVERNDVEALGVLAAIASKCSRPADAETWHWKRVEIAPARADVRLALGVFLWQELHDGGDWSVAQKRAKSELALAQLAKAAELQPTAPQPFLYSSYVWRDLAAAETTEAARRHALEESERYAKLALERQKAG